MPIGEQASPGMYENACRTIYIEAAPRCRVARSLELRNVTGHFLFKSPTDLLLACRLIVIVLPCVQPETETHALHVHANVQRVFSHR